MLLSSYSHRIFLGINILSLALILVACFVLQGSVHFLKAVERLPDTNNSSSSCTCCCCCCVVAVEDVNLSIVLLSVGVVKISPCENSRTFVNGKLVTESTVLRSGECWYEDTLDCL